jgi:hypothetical protein
MLTIASFFAAPVEIVRFARSVGVAEQGKGGWCLMRFS